MTLGWPETVLALGALAAAVVGLKTALPYLVGRSSERAREAALKDITERLNRVESVVSQGVRKMPGVLR